MSGSKEVTAVRTARTEEDVVNLMGNFLRHKETPKKKILSRLKHIMSVVQTSPFFKTHEVSIWSFQIFY